MKTPALLIGVALAALWSSPAPATLQVAADFGGTPFSCVDQAGCDTNLAVGTLQIADQVIGGIEVNGIGANIDEGDDQILNTSSLSAINTTADSILYTIAVGDNDFIGPVSSFLTAGSGVFQTAIESTVTLNWFNDPQNVQGAGTPTDTPGNLIDTFSYAVTLDADSFSHNGSGAVVDPAAFSMTLQASGKLVAGGEFLNRGQTEIKPQVVPEPGGLFILGAAFLTLGFIVERRRRTTMRSNF